MKIKKSIRILSLTIILAGAPLLLTNWGGDIFPFNEVKADIGTCCPDNIGLCIIGDLAFKNHYAIQAGSPCPEGNDPPYYEIET